MPLLLLLLSLLLLAAVAAAAALPVHLQVVSCSSPCHAGQAQVTYGTSCCILFNVGEEPVHSDSGMITAVAYQLGTEEKYYPQHICYY